MAEGKIVILGGKGMLGTDLAAACQKRGIDAAVLDLPEIDITKKEILRTNREILKTFYYEQVERIYSTIPMIIPTTFRNE